MRPVFGNLTFDQLETFSLEKGLASYNDEIFGMIFENRGLKKIHINMRVDRDRLFEVIDRLPKLNEISIKWRPRLPDTLEELLNGSRHHGLKRINVHTYFGNIHVFKKIAPSAWLR